MANAPEDKLSPEAAMLVLRPLLLERQIVVEPAAAAPAPQPAAAPRAAEPSTREPARSSLSFAVGITRPGPGDYFVPTQDCSQPTKPYEGYRTDDHCQDQLSWSGTVTITRVS